MFDLLHCFESFIGDRGGGTWKAFQAMEQRRGKKGGQCSGREEFNENINI